MFHSVYFMKLVGNICQRRTEDEKEKQNSKNNVTVNADISHAGNQFCVGRGGNCTVPQDSVVSDACEGGKQLCMVAE